MFLGSKLTIVTEAKHLGSSLETYVQFVNEIFFFFFKESLKWNRKYCKRKSTMEAVCYLTVPSPKTSISSDHPQSYSL